MSQKTSTPKTTKPRSEASARAAVVQWINAHLAGAVLWPMSAGPYCRPGMPDLMCLYCGTLYCIEMKRPGGGKVSAIQAATLKQLEAAGAKCVVARGVDDVKKLFGEG